MSYSVKIQIRTEERSTAGLSVDVTRFGTGYWIGIVGSTILCTVIPLAGWVDATLGKTGNAISLLLCMLACGTIPTMAYGFVQSLQHLRKGLETRDRNLLIGGGLGALLCIWPFLVFAFALLQYVEKSYACFISVEKSSSA